MSQHESKTTTDHNEIRKWAEKRGGNPTLVKGTEKNGSGLLRLDFEGNGKEDKLEEISWEKFFEIFDKNGLEFLYQEKTQAGGISRFFKFLEGENGKAGADESDHASKTTTKHGEIQIWAEKRDGKPAVVKGTDADGGGLLRIDFGEKEDNLEEITWEKFFRIFDENNLQFLYQEHTASGGTSRFFKFIKKED